MPIKFWSIVIIGICCVRGFSIAQEQPLMNVLSPQQSSNSVIFNDCNLRLTNTWLLLKRFGNDPAKSFWTANDVIAAHVHTLSSPDCWGNTASKWIFYSSSIIDNLCEQALLKLSRTWWETPYLPAKELRTRLSTSGTDANGIIPGAVRLKMLSILGYAPAIMRADANPEHCGRINVTGSGWLQQVYSSLLDSIYNIATDCGTNVPFTPGWNDRVLLLLWSSNQTPYVWWVQQWWVPIAWALERCQQKITASYNTLFNAAQVISITQGSAFSNEVLASWYRSIEAKNQVIAEWQSRALALLQDATQQTPITASCEIKW